VQTNPPKSSGATATEAEGEVIVLDGDTSAAATQPTQRIAQAPGHSGGSGVRRDAPFSPQELAAVRGLALSDHAFPLLVHSLCPTIYGHELVKAGLLLGLFGGSSTQAQSGRRSGPTAAADDDVSAHSAKDFKVRPDIHVLVVGDPGLGKVGDTFLIVCEDSSKCCCSVASNVCRWWCGNIAAVLCGVQSQMLRAAATVAPRAVFVTGNTSTAAGLTVSISRDSSGGGKGTVPVRSEPNCLV
jgi:DNA helicase MCM8